MRGGASLLLSALVLAAVGCGERPTPQAPPPPGLPPTSAESAALALVTLAGEDERPAEALASLFEAELLDEHRAAALDALDDLASLQDAVVEATADLGVDGTAAVDLVASLPGGGEARLSVRARLLDDGTWRIVAFAGPEGWWPPQPGGPGEGLSVSAEPDC